LSKAIPFCIAIGSLSSINAKFRCLGFSFFLPSKFKVPGHLRRCRPTSRCQTEDCDLLLFAVVQNCENLPRPALLPALVAHQHFNLHKMRIDGDCRRRLPGNVIMQPVMAVAEPVSAEQYLHLSFEHDAEFVEGRLVERPMPSWEHACMQGFLTEELRSLGRRLALFAGPEQRVHTRLNRFRVPDDCVVTDKPEGEPGRRIVTRPPYLCAEILSPEDTAVEMEKVREYLNFGVAWVWAIDPVSLSGQVHSRNSVVSVEGRIFSTDRFSVDLSTAEF